MSKAVKTIASIALPIVGNFIAPGIGGAIGGAIGGGLTGGLKGAIIGGIGGYASGGATNAIIGSPASLAPAGGIGPVTQGSGIWGALTGGGLKALSAGASAVASGAGSSPVSGLTGITNMLMSNETDDAIKKATAAQQAGINSATEAQAPYAKLGADAVSKINTIQADPAGYIKNHPFYNTLAEDAKNKLLANQAAKGKVGSGGTAAALQDQLLQIGNGLVNQDIGTLQQQAGIGQNSANNVSNLNVGGGVVNSAGVMGQNNNWQAAYQNQLNTLLALQSLGKVPTYGTIPQLNS